MTTQEVVGHQVITDEAEACRRLEHDNVIGIDLETSGLSPYVDSIATIQMYGDTSGTLALFHPRGNLSDNLRQLLARSGVEWLVHNGVAFDIPFLLANQVPADDFTWYDTMVGETVVVPTNRRDVSKSLRSSVKRRLDVDLDKKLAVSHWMAEELSPDQVRYATSDVVHLPALWRSQLKNAEDSDRARSSENAEKPGIIHALQFEMQLVPIFARMTFNGMPISISRLHRFLDAQHHELELLRPAFEADFGTINPNSWQQVARVFKERGIAIPNTHKETMIELAQYATGEPARLATLLLKYRKPAQRLKMYRPEWVSKHVVNGRAHPRFWQCSTDTTRVASSDPNLQQVPRDMRDPWGWEPGTTIVSSDFSQIEVRLAAYLAKDDVLMRLLEHEDTHTAIAAETRGIPVDEVTRDMRKAAKAQTFTLLFGGGPDTLYQYSRMQGSSMTELEARQMVSKFFQTFQGLGRFKAWAESQAQRVSDGDRRNLSLRLPAGHRRLLFGSQARSTIILNTLVQGRAATGIKYAMLECKRRGLTKYLSIQVHDELVAAVPDAEALDYARELDAAMKAGMANVMDAVIKTGTIMGPSWGYVPEDTVMWTTDEVTLSDGTKISVGSPEH